MRKSARLALYLCVAVVASSATLLVMGERNVLPTGILYGACGLLIFRLLRGREL